MPQLGESLLYNRMTLPSIPPSRHTRFELGPSTLQGLDLGVTGSSAKYYMSRDPEGHKNPSAQGKYNQLAVFSLVC